MRLTDIIGMQQLITSALQADGGDAHGFTNMSVIPTFHPPSSKRPMRIKQLSPADGWHSRDSSSSKLRARQDMVEILKRTARQPGRGAFAQPAITPWYPTQ